MYQQLKDLLKKLKRFIVFHDWTWSVVFAFLTYWVSNWGPPSLMGVPMTYYAINWLQAIVATAGVMAGLYSIARLGLWFNLRKLHQYIYGQKNERQSTDELSEQRREQPTYNNYSFADFKKIEPRWVKLLFASFWLALFFVVATIVFLKLLSAASVV